MSREELAARIDEWLAGEDTIERFPSRTAAILREAAQLLCESPPEPRGREWTLRRWNDPHANECSDWQVGEWPEHLRGDTRNEQVRVREVSAPPEPSRVECDCEKVIGKDFLLSGHRQDGERVDCPRCGRDWVHTCDEAEGCTWARASKVEPAQSPEQESRGERFHETIAAEDVRRSRADRAAAAQELLGLLDLLNRVYAGICAALEQLPSAGITAEAYRELNFAAGLCWGALRTPDQDGTDRVRTSGSEPG